MSEQSLIPPEKKYRYYVTATDSFMSGWGPAKSKTNKLVFCCNSYEQAQVVEENLKNRSEMKYVNICSTKPSYPGRRYLVQWFTPGGEYPNFYKKGYFKRK
jgi:hypothetical protein